MNFAPIIDDGRRKDWLRAAYLARFNAQMARRAAREYGDAKYLAEAAAAHERAMHYLYWARQFKSGRYARSH